MSQTATSSPRPPAAPPPSSPAADYDGISDDASSSLPPSDRLDNGAAVSTSAGDDEDGGSTSSSSSEANGLTPPQRTAAAPRTNINKKTTSSTSATSTPLVLKNPDGSLVAAFGAEYVQRKPPPSPKYTPSWLDESVATELEYIYSRHEQLFLTLLVLQLLVEAACGGLYVYYAGSIIQEMCFVYAKFLSPSVVHKLFYAAVIVDVLYEFAYFHAGAYAVWKNKVRHYERFATLAFLGCCLQVLFAFASKFNLVCFLFRLTAYVYAKFFRNYLRSLSIVQREHV